MTNISRVNLKRAILSRLDAVAEPHRLGHQDDYANRYVMRSDHDARVELMFEKGSKTEPYLWVLAKQVTSISNEEVPSEFYSKEDIYKIPAKNGGMQYGRHSALEKMTLLGRDDLVRFTLRSLQDLNHILLVLKQAQRQKAVT
jgi:hypothetical protein